jgi:hypothetical protein
VHVPHGRIYGAKSCLSSLNSSTEFDLSHADVLVAFCSLRIATGLCAGRMLVCVRARRHGEYMLILAEQDYSGGRIHTQTYTDTETHTHTHTHLHTHMHLSLSLSLSLSQTHTLTHTDTHTHTHTHTHIYTYKHTPVYSALRAGVPLEKKNSDSYIHIHRHTHIHTHILACSVWRAGVTPGNRDFQRAATVPTRRIGSCLH